MKLAGRLLAAGDYIGLLNKRLRQGINAKKSALYFFLETARAKHPQYQRLKTCEVIGLGNAESNSANCTKKKDSDAACSRKTKWKSSKAYGPFP